MLLRALLTVLLYVVTIACTFSALRRASRREKLVCAVVYIASVYFAYNFVRHYAWPSLDDLMQLVLGDAARFIVASLKKP